MNENWHPTDGPDDQQGRASDGTTEAADAAPVGPAIALPPANSGEGATVPVAAPMGGTELPPTGPHPVGAGWQTPPAGNPPYATPPVGTPAGGVWTPPPGSGWTPGPGAPYAAWAAGSPPPPGGWAQPGYAYPAAPPPSSTAKKRTGLVAGAAAVVLVAAVLGGVGLGHSVWPSQKTLSATSGGSGGTGASGGGSSSGGTLSPFGGSGSSSSSGNSSTGAGAPSDISAIAAKVSPDLVDINTNLSYQDEQAAGTGMVLTSDGIVLTNNHVIDGATSISVTDVGNHKTYNATVVGYDRTGDIAVIKLVNASGLQTVTTNTSTAAVGQAVVGVGNAGGTGGTPSTAGGSITAVDQSITASDDGGGNSENLTGLIESNAGIQPGDSGGSLVNTSGQVIGMDTAASADSAQTSSATQAYSIPIATALTVAKEIEDGKASSTIHIGGTGFLGVSVASGASSSSGSGGIGGTFGGGFGGGDFGSSGSSGSSGSTGASATGATVESTLSGSAAAAAGVVAGDVITAVDGTTITSATGLSNALEGHHPGDTVHLTWTNASGTSQTASVTLASGPPA